MLPPIGMRVSLRVVAHGLKLHHEQFGVRAVALRADRAIEDQRFGPRAVAAPYHSKIGGLTSPPLYEGAVGGRVRVVERNRPSTGQKRERLRWRVGSGDGGAKAAKAMPRATPGGGAALSQYVA